VSVAGELKPPAANGGTGAGSRRHRLLTNAEDWLALLGRRPRPGTARPGWRTPARLALIGLPALIAVAGTMVWLDAPTMIAVGGLPEWITRLFNELTDYGTSDWFLVPIGIALLGLAALAPRALSHLGQLVLVAGTVRLGFVFAAIALPGLFVTILKRLIGRARPFIGGDADPFHFAPFIWRPDYASLPSGHAANVFAALVAVGLVWPRLRPIMLVYALIIAASRVIVLAHHPSDVIAGAVVGTIGALMVRDWFAARRLGFVIAPDGTVRVLPGPSGRRLRNVLERLVRAGA
jgi:membrane-associated phospholipid phosphatase